MPDIRLTDAEREGLWDTSVDAFGMTYPPQVIVAFVTAALSAVPRLALAAPVVGELVEIARDYQVQAELFAGDGCHLDPTLADLRRKLAAITGEEGRDG